MLQNSQNKKRFILFIIGIVLALIMHILTSICHDGYFMCRQGESILHNGFAHSEYISLHTDLPFTDQRVLMCLFTYLLCTLFGEYGILIGAFIINLCLILLLACIMYRCICTISFIHYILIFSLFIALTLFGDLRANSVMACIMIITYLLCERYSDKKLKAISFCGIMFLLGIFCMWLQSSCFYMPIIMMLPYMCDFKFLRKVQFVSKVADNGVENVGIYWIASFMFFIGGILNPYGIDSYVYAYKCLTAMQCFYVPFVHEMERGSISFPTLIVYVTAIVLIISIIRKKRVHLRVVYYILGCCLLAFSAYRQSFFAIVIILLCYYHMWSNDYIKGNDYIKSNAVAKRCTVVSYIMIGIVILWSLLVILGSFSESSYTRLRIKNNIASIDLIKENIDDISDKHIFSVLADTGSYAAFLHAIPYMDNRAEFYDIYFNECRSVWAEYGNILFDLDLIDLAQFRNKYDFDYYIVPNRDSELCTTLHSYLDENAYINFDCDFFMIYSFRDSGTFTKLPYGSNSDWGLHDEVE